MVKPIVPHKNPMKSDLKRHSGRFWAKDAIWNQPLSLVSPNDELTQTLRQTVHQVRLAVTGMAPIVIYSGKEKPLRVVTDRHNPDQSYGIRVPTGMDPVPPDYAAVIIDETSRLVISGENWQRHDSNDWTVEDLAYVSLDGEGWGSIAVGLILERELLNAQIDHVIGVLCPNPEMYGLRIRISPTVDVTNLKGGPINEAVARALQQYGGICVGESDDIVIRCERSQAATGPDDPGPLYRGRGISDGRLTLDPQLLTVCV